MTREAQWYDDAADSETLSLACRRGQMSSSTTATPETMCPNMQSEDWVRSHVHDRKSSTG